MRSIDPRYGAGIDYRAVVPFRTDDDKVAVSKDNNPITADLIVRAIAEQRADARPIRSIQVHGAAAVAKQRIGHDDFAAWKNRHGGAKGDAARWTGYILLRRVSAYGDG